MKFISYLENKENIKMLKDAGVGELILGHQAFSRFGQLDDVALYDFAQTCKEHDIRAIFEWDILLRENDLDEKCALISQMDLSSFAAIRVCDLGALKYCMEHFPKHKIQLNLEMGHHNLAAIKKWCDFAGERLDRVVLSIEIPRETLLSYVKALPVPVEILALGRIPLFYTPRKLLSWQCETTSNNLLMASGESEESPHKGFPILENAHGSFMFYIKDYSLLDFSDDFNDLEEKLSLRIDLRFGKDVSLIKEVVSILSSKNVDKQKIDIFKAHYPENLTRAFWAANRSDILFSKLKNERIDRTLTNYLGDIVHVVKGVHMVLLIKNPTLVLKTNDQLELKTPEGKSFLMNVFELHDSKGEVMNDVKEGQLVFLKHIKKITVRSAVYLL